MKNGDRYAIRQVPRTPDADKRMRVVLEGCFGRDVGVMSSLK
jgi:hypothetical protein